MKINKAERITKVKVEFNRGFIEGDDNKDFFTLSLGAFKEFVDDGDGFGYCYWNWSKNDLKELADSIYALLKEVDTPPKKEEK